MPEMVAVSRRPAETGEDKAISYELRLVWSREEQAIVDQGLVTYRSTSGAKHLRLSDQLLINGRPFKSTFHKVAYGRQDDFFFSQLTVRETLSLAASLQLSQIVNKEKYVDDLLNRLGLMSCAGTIVGDNKVRGVSGGEKKRLSIACELIASPSVIFADEPTTGLDAFQAEKVMETLRQLAEDGHTAIIYIHQPRGSIYSKFDHLIRLSEGYPAYMGPAGDDAISYFEDIGCTIIPRYMRLLIPVAHKALDLYADMFGSTTSMHHLVSSLSQHPHLVHGASHVW